MCYKLQQQKEQVRRWGGRDSFLGAMQTVNKSLQGLLDAPVGGIHGNKDLISPIAILISFTSILGKQMEI